MKDMKGLASDADGLTVRIVNPIEYTGALRCSLPCPSVVVEEASSAAAAATTCATRGRQSCQSQCQRFVLNVSNPLRWTKSGFGADGAIIGSTTDVFSPKAECRKAECTYLFPFFAKRIVFVCLQNETFRNKLANIKSKHGQTDGTDKRTEGKRADRHSRLDRALGSPIPSALLPFRS